MKYFLAGIGIIVLLIILWYLGFLDFLGLKAPSCIIPDETGVTPGRIGSYKYGKCNVTPLYKPEEANTDCVNGCSKSQYGRDCNGFLDPVNCGAGRYAINWDRELKASERIAQEVNRSYYNARISNAQKIIIINQQLGNAGISNIVAIEKGGSVPAGFKLCDCKYGQHEVISFWQWAFAGGCGGISVGGAPCFPA